MLNILLPSNSRRRRYIKRIIDRRRLNFKKRQYNAQRVAYYNNALRHSLRSGPLVSIVVPAFNTPLKYLEPLLGSIFSQGYENWELVLVDASDNEKCSKNIFKCAQSDSRITYIKSANGGIAANTNVGIKRARGEFTAFMDHDDTLDPDALAVAMQLFIDKPKYDLIYSDEDKISENGDLYLMPHYKSDFSLDMLRSVNYITHFVIVRSVIAKKLLIREGFEGAQDYDFLLRVVDSGAEIGHTSGISYHWRLTPNSTAENFSNKKHITDAGVRALENHYERCCINNVSVKAIDNRPGFYEAGYSLNDGKKRAICISIKGQADDKIIEDAIINLYKKNKDVIKNQYNIVTKLTESQKKTYKSILYVNDIIIPTQDETPISNLFALAEENGVFGVTPRVVSSGQIYDIGLVSHDGLLLPLGRNVAPVDFSFFGSHEWSRNVAGLTGKIIAVSYNDEINFTNTNLIQELSIKSQHRKTICGDSEFIKLYSPNTKNETPGRDYYNDCLNLEYKPIVATKMYVEEVIKVEK